MMNKRKDVLFPRVTLCAAKRRLHFFHPLFLGYLFFFFFYIFLKILKKNKIILRYKGGMSVTSKHTSSRCKEHTNAQSKETCAGNGHSGKSSPWVKVSGRRGKVLQGLCIRHALKV
jgi:hypothetical protein